VLWERTLPTLELAARRGHRLIAIEDVGECAPWQVDLTGAVVLVVGSERNGLGADMLARCESVVRVPMAGFVPSYNLQAAISAVAVERLRQLAALGR
jgi:tRNA G18 (ribose-2'-O)-methylase SpoU